MFIQSSELIANPGKSSVVGPMVPQMRDLLAGTTGIDWYAWAVLTGRPFGSYLISTRFENYATMADVFAKVGASSEWADFSSTADGLLANPAETYLGEVVAVTGEPTAPKAFTSVTRATMSGAVGDGVTFAVQLMEHASSLIGSSGTVATSAAGTMFQVFWIAGSDTADELDANADKIRNDARYAEMIAEAGAAELYVPGSVERMLLMQMP